MSSKATPAADCFHGVWKSAQRRVRKRQNSSFLRESVTILRQAFCLCPGTVGKVPLISPNFYQLCVFCGVRGHPLGCAALELNKVQNSLPNTLWCTILTSVSTY